MQAAKFPLRSKTVWFNVLAGVAFVAAAVPQSVYDGTGDLDPSQFFFEGGTRLSQGGTSQGGTAWYKLCA